MMSGWLLSVSESSEVPDRDMLTITKRFASLRLMSPRLPIFMAGFLPVPEA